MQSFGSCDSRIYVSSARWHDGLKTALCLISFYFYLMAVVCVINSMAESCSRQAADAIDVVWVIWCHGNKRLDNCCWKNPLLLKREKGRLSVSVWYRLEHWPRKHLASTLLCYNGNGIIWLIVLVRPGCSRIRDQLISLSQPADGGVKPQYRRPQILLVPGDQTKTWASSFGEIDMDAAFPQCVC